MPRLRHRYRVAARDRGRAHIAALVVVAVAWCAGPSVPAIAEMTIHLKDGRIYTIPADRGDIDRIDYFDRKAAPPPPAAVRPAATRGPVLRVGPGETLKAPSDAAKIVQDGDIVEIAAGLYEGDVAAWYASNLILRAVGGRVRLDSLGAAAEGKAIWVIKGDNAVVDGIEFSNCRVSGRNCAGIRLEGTNLTVRNSAFLGNEMGILTGSNLRSDILIEHSEFARNTVDYLRYKSLGHNIYIGRVRSFTLRYSYVHHAAIGHNVKSRALVNRILYNRLTDEADGSSSYIVDLPNGGTAAIVGNVIHQSAHTDNQAVINFGTAERAQADRLYVVHNTMVNDNSTGVFVQNRSTGLARVVNNILVGPGAPLTGLGSASGNLIADLAAAPGPSESYAPHPGISDLKGNVISRFAGLTRAAAFDYRLAPGSPAIDAAGALPADAAVGLTPEAQYVHPRMGTPRAILGYPDIGAYEFLAR